MKKVIYIVQPLNNLKNSKKFFIDFNSIYNYLSDIDIKYTPEETYYKYTEDFANLNRSWMAKAEIIDTRNLKDYENEPVRLLLSKDFFNSDINEQKEIILHELGHYLTNTNLTEIRNFIAKENPKTLGINNSNLTSLVNAHNEGLSYIFQIPKLIQEVNAELWTYENEPEFCKTRLELYCRTIEEFIESSNNEISISKDFFYQIPKLTFLILWREAIIKHTNFDFSKNCLANTKSAFEVLKKLASNSGWGDLKLLAKKDDILKSIEYKNENIESIQTLYIELFEEFIFKSSSFFPLELKKEIQSFYNL